MPYGYLLKYSSFHRLQMVSLIFLLANTTPMSRLLRLLDLALSGPFGERWLPHGLDKLDHGLLEFSPFQGRCCMCFMLSAPLKRMVPATANAVLYGYFAYRGLRFAHPRLGCNHRSAVPYGCFALPWVALRSPTAGVQSPLCGSILPPAALPMVTYKRLRIVKSCGRQRHVFSFQLSALGF